LGIALPATIADQEILAAIGLDGTTTAALAAVFKIRLTDKRVKEQLIASLKWLVENISTCTSRKIFDS
jgi:hypothetical protein